MTARTYAKPTSQLSPDGTDRSGSSSRHPPAKGVSSAAQPARLRAAVRQTHDRYRAIAWAVVDAAEVLQPDALIIENVSAFTTWHLYPNWSGTLEALGYTVTEHIIDSAGAEFAGLCFQLHSHDTVLDEAGGPGGWPRLCHPRTRWAFAHRCGDLSDGPAAAVCECDHLPLEFGFGLRHASDRERAAV